jgi:hypothetical protein
VQPKAAGSSLILKLTSAMALDVIKLTGIKGSLNMLFIFSWPKFYTVVFCAKVFDVLRHV